jgi:hypothetical protein
MSDFTEAPASFNIKAESPTGFDCMLTLRSESTADLMPRALKALEWLADNGFRPTRPFGRSAAAAAEAPAAAGSNGNGAPARPVTAGNGKPSGDTAICPLHDALMTRKTGRNGDTWFSHKAVRPDGTEYWCKGK